MKSKKHKSHNQVKETVEDENHQKLKKDKKKKKKGCDAEAKAVEIAELVQAAEEPTQPVKEKKRKRKDKDKEVEVIVADECNEQDEVQKKKKKKKKHEKLQEEELVVEDESSPPPKKKKKKQKTHHEDEPAHDLGDEENFVHTNETTDVSAENKRKKSKRDKQNTVADGNGVNECEEDSHKQPASDLGQWSTADLGDNTRQNKFYQLLGGFKSSSANAKSSMKPFAAKFNAALDKKRETQLNNQLERQFEDARLAQFSAKGVGLGFSQPKKNHIDITTSRSKKFDD